jgi:hypothetical protein
MNKLKTVLVLVGIGMMMTACGNSSVNESTTTHVKDLVQSDVFGVLPDGEIEMLVYNNSEEIEGEYLELATVEIQSTKQTNSFDEVVEMLKKEAKTLGGNGILLIEQNNQEDAQAVTQEVKAIAIYALDRVPTEKQLVSL